MQVHCTFKPQFSICPIASQNKSYSWSPVIWHRELSVGEYNLFNALNYENQHCFGHYWSSTAAIIQSENISKIWWVIYVDLIHPQQKKQQLFLFLVYQHSSTTYPLL